MSENLELVKSAYDAFGRSDIPTVLDMVDDRVDWDVTAVLPQGGSWRGRDGAAEFFGGLGENWADFTVDVEETLDAGDHVVALGRAAGKLRPAGDAAAGYTFVHVFTVGGGKIVRFREWADPDEVLREYMR